MMFLVVWANVMARTTNNADRFIVVPKLSLKSIQDRDAFIGSAKIYPVTIHPAPDHIATAKQEARRAPDALLFWRVPRY